MLKGIAFPNHLTLIDFHLWLMVCFCCYKDEICKWTGSFRLPVCSDVWWIFYSGKKSLDVKFKFIFASIGHVATQIIMHCEANLKWTTLFYLFIFCLNNLYLNLYNFWGKIIICLLTSLKTSVGRRKQIKKKSFLQFFFFFF